MNKVATLLKTLQESGGMTFAELRQASGEDNPASHLNSAIKRGQVIVTGEHGSKVYAINPDYIPRQERAMRDALPVKRKKRGDKKTPGKTLRAIADRITSPQPANLQRLLIDNLTATVRDLATGVRNHVDGFENNPDLQQLLQQADRAVALMEHAA